MTTITIERPGPELDDALRHVQTDHEAVLIRQGGRVVAVIVPPEEYLPVRDEDIPPGFWQGLRESRAGLGVDMETALNEAPAGV
jgi:PHD/YefM family antitoxin component YafN of YafNO toxin-antitoxin module